IVIQCPATLLNLSSSKIHQAFSSSVASYPSAKRQSGWCFIGLQARLKNIKIRLLIFLEDSPSQSLPTHRLSSLASTSCPDGHSTALAMAVGRAGCRQGRGLPL